MIRRNILVFLAVLWPPAPLPDAGAAAPGPGGKPNLIFILADDLGYGDVSCYNRDSRVLTPHIDRLAAQGMRFTDAHTPSGVCSPTRYGVLTGRYSWRSTLKSGVLQGYSPPLIPPQRETVASFLKRLGYRTAAIGKWHLGMDLPTTDGRPIEQQSGVPPKADWKGLIRNGPTTRGFDYFFGCTASWDMPPYAWIENDRFVRTDLIPTDTSDRFGRAGVKSPGIKPEDALPTLTGKALDYIASAAKAHAGAPFFLYFALTAPHTPVAPSSAFKGRSQAGDYGDFVVEVDEAIGRVIALLDQTGLSANTLVILTSDNGPERSMIKRKAEFGHHSASHFLGCKRDNWEGGHRVPFIARWPGRVPAGATSAETICLTDFMATAAALAGKPLPPNAGEDSCNLVPVLTGSKLERPLREATVHHSSTGEFAIRQGRWKLLLHAGSGGNNYRADPRYAAYYEKARQLYDLSADPDETTNVADGNPQVVAQLTALMRRYVLDGRSTPGLAQANDTPNDWAQLSWLTGGEKPLSPPAKGGGGKKRR